MLPPEAMLMFVVYVATWDHVDVLGSYYHQRTSGCQGPGLPSETMLMSWVINQGPWRCLWHQGPWKCLWSALPQGVMLMFVVYATAWGHADVYDPCCQQRPCGCLWSWTTIGDDVDVCDHDVWWIHVIHTARGHDEVRSPWGCQYHVNVCGPCSWGKSFGSPWPMLPLFWARKHLLQWYRWL